MPLTAYTPQGGDNMLDNENPSKKPLVFYVTIAMVIIFALNAFVMPMLLTRQVQEV
jgi:hypothetical protein